MSLSPQPVDGSVDNGYRRNIRSVDLRTNDIAPTCPRCFEFNATHAVVCLYCGARLTENPPMTGRPGAWSTSA